MKFITSIAFIVDNNDASLTRPAHITIADRQDALNSQLTDGQVEVLVEEVAQTEDIDSSVPTPPTAPPVRFIVDIAELAGFVSAYLKRAKVDTLLGTDDD